MRRSLLLQGLGLTKDALTFRSVLETNVPQGASKVVVSRCFERTSNYGHYKVENAIDKTQPLNPVTNAYSVLAAGIRCLPVPGF